MKNNIIFQIADSIDKISDLTETEIIDIVDSLIGVAWDEEDAGEIKRHLEDR